MVLAWQDVDHVAATVSSDDLEKAYIAKGSPKLNFKAGRHEYELSFGGRLHLLWFFILFLLHSLPSSQVFCGFKLHYWRKFKPLVMVLSSLMLLPFQISS